MANEQKNQTPVYIFVASFALIVIAALIFVWSDYTSNGVLGMRLELASYIIGAIGVVGLIVNWVRQ